MTKEQLELLLDFIYESITTLKAELQGDDPYWANRRADAIRNKLFETLTGEQDNG